MSGKKIIILALAVIIFVAAGCLLDIALRPKTVDIPMGKAILRYRSPDYDVYKELPAEDAEIIYAIFDNKKLYSDKPSCNFTEEISIQFDDAVFCIACDSCNAIKYGNRYFNVSDADRKVIDELFTRYDGTFPCE